MRQSQGEDKHHARRLPARKSTRLKSAASEWFCRLPLHNTGPTARNRTSTSSDLPVAMSMRSLLSKVLPVQSRLSRDSSYQSSDEEESSGWSEKLEELYQKTKSFHGSHQQFFIRLSLSLSVAFWVTLFSLPLYFGKLHYIVFGFRGELHETYSAYGRDPACESYMVGKMRNIGSSTCKTSTKTHICLCTSRDLSSQ